MDLQLTKDDLKFASAKPGHQYVAVVLELKKVELFVDSLDIRDMVLIIILLV